MFSGFGVITLTAGLTAVSYELVEAAKVDGANAWQVARHVLVPALRGPLVVVGVVSVIFALRTFDIVYVMTEGGPAQDTMVLALLLWQQAFVFLDTPQAELATAVAVLLSVVLVAGHRHLRQLVAGGRGDRGRVQPADSRPLRVADGPGHRVAGAGGEHGDDVDAARVADPFRLVESEPRRPDLRQLRSGLGPGPVGYVVNSFLITILSVVLTVAAGSLAAYAYARMAFRFKATTYFLLITTMIVPVQIILIPMLPWFRTLGLSGGRRSTSASRWSTPPSAGWAVFMLGSFFATIPGDLLEAARIDGAGWFDVFRRIALPLAVPGIVSFAIIDFVFVWNDLLLALTLLGRDHQPLTVGLANLQSPHLAQDDLVAAGSIMAILPPLLLFVALNRFYVRGLFAGATKG